LISPGAELLTYQQSLPTFSLQTADDFDFGLVGKMAGQQCDQRWLLCRPAPACGGLIVRPQGNSVLFALEV
jgi:hypothetical protein